MPPRFQHRQFYFYYSVPCHAFHYSYLPAGLLGIHLLLFQVALIIAHFISHLPFRHFILLRGCRRLRWRQALRAEKAHDFDAGFISKSIFTPAQAQPLILFIFSFAFYHAALPLYTSITISPTGQCSPYQPPFRALIFSPLLSFL